jgi:hypothetical protein
MFANIEWWGSIEVNAPVFTACLPTLGPLVRGRPSLRSMLGSFTSLFSRSTLSSPGRVLHGNENSQSFTSNKHKWYELQSRRHKSDITARVSGSDVEARSQNSDAIMVHETFVSREE